LNLPNSRNARSLSHATTAAAVSPRIAAAVALAVAAATGLAVAAIAVAALLPAPAALAHAFLQSADPTPETSLPAPPAQVTLRFSEPLVAGESVVRLLDLRGNPIVEREVTLGADPRVAVVDAPALSPGVYMVHWTALSALDGHVESGTYWFRVAAGPGEVSGSARGAGGAVEGGTVKPAEAAVKGLGFLAALLLFGMHAVRLAAGAGIGPAARALLLFATLIQTAYWALLWIGQIRPVLPGLGTGPRFLVASQALTALSALYLSYLFARKDRGAGAGLADRSPGADPAGSSWAGAACGAAALGAFALTGHAAGTPAAPISAVAFDWVHMAAAGVWTGAIAHLAFNFQDRSLPFTGSLIRRLTRIVFAVAAALLLTGIFSAELRGVEPGALIETRYGRALAWKLVFVALTALLGAFHAFVVNPWRQKGASQRLWRAAVAAEGAALLLVLAATAVLTLSPPPRATSAGSAGREAGPGLTLATNAGVTLIETTIAPNGPGDNRVTVRLTDDEEGTRRVVLQVLPGGVAAELRPVRGEPGMFSGRLELPAAGAYSLRVTLVGASGQEREAEYTRWPVPAPGALELVRKADEAMSRLSTVRVLETLSDGENTVERIWWYQAPDRVRAETVDGSSKLVIVGTLRWTTADGVTWERDELFEPLAVPGFAYAENATEVTILGREDVTGREAFVVSFRYKDGSYRFVAWIDAADYKLLRLTMDGPHHFMVWEFSDFNAPFDISPPG